MAYGRIALTLLVVLALGPTPESRQAAYRALVENCPIECDVEADKTDGAARVGPSSLVIGV